MELRTKKIARMGLLLAVAMVASYLESLLPTFVAVPGVKLGLANGVSMYLLYRGGVKPAAGLSVLRIVLSALLFQGLFAMVYSLAGAFCSLCVMACLKKTRWFSTVGVSVAGGVMHNAGQLIVAMIVLENKNLFWYFGALIVSGLAAGIVVGVLTGVLLERLPRIPVEF